MNFNKTTKIYIAGHRGMVGSAVWRALKSKGYSNLIGKTVLVHNGKEFKKLLITREKIGFKFGEFVFTRSKMIKPKKSKSLVKNK